MVQVDPETKSFFKKLGTVKSIDGLSTFYAQLIFQSLGRHIAFKKRFVDKIVYDTKKEEFTLAKRNFWGVKKDYHVSRLKLLYT